MTISSQNNIFPSSEQPVLIVSKMELTMLETDEALAVMADFSYNPREPYAVRMTLSMGGPENVTWTFGRDLLRTGLMFADGIGDVRIQPHPYGLIIELHHSHGVSKFFAFPEPILEFVQRSLRAVPEGTEESFYSIDIQIATIFADPTRPEDSSQSADTTDGASADG